MSKNRKQSNYKDRDGKILAHGDIVRFYYSATYGYWLDEASGDKKDFTEMIDIVHFDGESWRLYSDIGRASYIGRHNDFCKLIGNVWDNPELVKSFPASLVAQI